MIKNGDYFMTRDKDGTRCVWDSKRGVRYERGKWDGIPPCAELMHCDEEAFLDKEWADWLAASASAFQRAGRAG